MFRTPDTQHRRCALVVIAPVAFALLAAGCSSSGGDSDPSGDAPGQPVGTGKASGFEANTADCMDPSAASKRITGSWKIGYSAPLSGPVAGIVAVSLDGFKARIAAQNAAGGVNGVKIDVKFLDDSYTPDKTKANATQFLQSDHVDSMITFGSGGVAAIADDVAIACTPLLYPSSSVQEYRDISQYPWVVQYLPAGDAQARYDIRLIKQKFPDGASVGIAENQNASGKGASDAFQKAAKGTNVTVKVVADSTDPNAAATKLKSAGVDVVYNAGVSTDCGPAVTAMSRIGFTPKLVVNPDSCSDTSAYVAAGKAADGNALPTYLKNPSAPALATDPGVKKYLSEVTGLPANVRSNQTAVSGWVAADLTINTLKQAAASPRGLSRVGVIEAARDQTYASPMFIKGITWLSSPKSLIGFSGFQTALWDSETKTFKPDGAIVRVGAR